MEQIASNFENVHHLTDNMNDDGTDRVVNKTYRNVLNEPVKIDEIEFVTPKEIKKAISTTKAKKAPGLNGIQNIALKNLPKKAHVILTYIFNACFKYSYYASCWKKANVLPIHKVGKDELFSQSYRPISDRNNPNLFECIAMLLLPMEIKNKYGQNRFHYS